MGNYAVYLFTGTDEFRKDISIEKVKDSLHISSDFINYNVYNARENNSAEIIQSLTTLPVLDEYRLVVLKDADKLPEEDKGHLISYFQNPAKKSVFILTINKQPDSNDKLIAAARKHAKCVDFAMLKPQECSLWIAQEFKARNKSIEAKAIEFLKSNTPTNLNIINNLIEQICLYAAKRSKITLEDVKALIDEAPEISAFSLVEQMSLKRQKKALEILFTLIRSGKDIHQILGLISWNIRRLGRTKVLLNEGKLSEEIAKNLKVSYYVAGKLISQAGNFTLQEIKKAQRLLVETDFNLKRNPASPNAMLGALVARLSSNL